MLESVAGECKPSSDLLPSEALAIFTLSSMVQQEKEENDGNQSEREEARRQELIEALDEEGIGLNEESKLCKSYIANGSMGGWTAEVFHMYVYREYI